MLVQRNQRKMAPKPRNVPIKQAVSHAKRPAVAGEEPNGGKSHKNSMGQRPNVGRSEGGQSGSRFEALAQVDDMETDEAVARNATAEEAVTGENENLNSVDDAVNLGDNSGKLEGAKLTIAGQHGNEEFMEQNIPTGYN